MNHEAIEEHKEYEEEQSSVNHFDVSDRSIAGHRIWLFSCSGAPQAD
jgi:hypothetical protein